MLTLTELNETIQTYCDNLKASAERQYNYDVNTNLKYSMTPEEITSERALKMAIVSATSNFYKWEVNATIKLCIDLLTDVNAHTEATALKNLL